MPAADGLSLDVRKRMRAIEVRAHLQFEPGVTLVVGPSGAGKTTLLRMIAGLTQPDEGRIVLGGRTLDDGVRTHVAPPGRNVGLVFQDYALFEHLDVARNVGYGLAARHVAVRERERRVAAMLERLAIAELARERPLALSGGQRQRVALARALVIEPGVLLLDEPLAALDLLTRGHVRAELAALLLQLSIPTVFVTHDPNDAATFSERIVVMEDGAISADAPLAALDPNGSAFLSAFLEGGRALILPS